MKKIAENILTAQDTDLMTAKNKRIPKIRRFGLLLLSLLAGAVFANTFVPTAEAHFGQASNTKPCIQCHTDPGTSANGKNIYIAIDGTEMASPSVNIDSAAGGSFEIDFYFTGMTRGESVGTLMVLPDATWIGAQGTTTYTPTGANMTANWNGAAWNVGAGGAHVPFTDNLSYTSNYAGTTYDHDGAGGGNKDDTACDLGGTACSGGSDVDTVPGAMGGDFVVTVPPGYAPGTYTVNVYGIGTGDSGSKGYVLGTVTVNVTSAGNNNPNVPANLAQYQADAVTVIPVGGWAGATSVVLEADISDPDGADTVRLQVDIDGDALSDCQSALVANPSTNVQVTCTVANNTAYDWQARTVDNNGAFSGWVAFDAATPDFTVDDNNPVDGSLSGTPGSTQIDLSWSGFSDADSGLDATDSYKLVYNLGATIPSAGCIDGTEIVAVTTGATYLHSGLTNGQQYSYRICAIDTAGNISSGATYQGSPSAGCIPAAPTLSVDTANQQITSGGGSVAYNISITNNDDVSCADASFNLTANDSNGGDFIASTFGTDPTPLIAPGGTYNTTITVSAVASPTNGATNDTSFSIVNDGSHGTPVSNAVTTLINTARTATMKFNIGEIVHFEYRTATRFFNNGANALTVTYSDGTVALGPVSMLEVQSGGEWIYTYDWDTTGQTSDQLQLQVNNGGTNIVMSAIILDNPPAQINLFADAGHTTPTNIFANLDTVYVEVQLPSPETAISANDVANWYSAGGFVPTINNFVAGSTVTFDFVVDFAAASVADGDWAWYNWIGQDTGIEFHEPIQRNDAGCGTCTRTDPSVSIVTGNQTISTEAGSVNYTINVTNNDTVACGSSSFDLVAFDSDTTAFNVSVFTTDPLSVAPGVTGSTVMTVSSKAGFYTGSNDSYFYSAADANHGQSLNSNTVTTSLNVPDLVAPTVTISAPTDGATINGAAAEPIVVTGTAADDRGTVTGVDVSINGGAWTPASTSDGYANWTWNWAGAADGSYTIDARASDGTNTGNATQVNVTIDRTPPTTTDNAVAAWTATDRNVTLTPDDGAGTGIAGTVYCVDSSNSCIPATPYVGPFNITQVGGQENLQYLRYFSTDSAGNTETTVSKTVRIDKKTPVDGAPLNLTPGDGQIGLAWNVASDLGSGLDTTNPYKVVRAVGTTTPPADCSGVAIYQGNLTSYTDTGLTNGVDYAYRVCAYDAVTNVSTGLTGTTQPAAACVRNNPSITVTPSQDITTDGGFVDYTVTVTNNDVGGCAAQSFDVKVFNDTNIVDFNAPAFPAGATSASIGPGANDSTVVVRATAVNGSLNGAAKTMDIATDGAADPNHADSAAVNRTTTINVPCTTAPDVTITTGNQSIATDGGSVGYTVQVSNNNALACGPVSLDLVAVNSNGTAFDPPTFSVDPLAVNPGGASNTTTMTVQAKSGALNNSTTNTYFYTAVNGTIPQSANSNVVVTTISRPCQRVAPSFSHGVDQNIPLDGAAQYTLTIINNDVDCVDSSTFTFGIDSETGNTSGFTLPSTFSAPSVTVAEGSTNSSVTFTVTANGTGADGNNLLSAIRISDATNHGGQDQTTTATTTLKQYNPLIHSSLSTGSTKHSGDGGWGIAGGKYGEFTCDLCHVKNATNIKRVRTVLPNAPDTGKGDFPGAGGAISFLDARSGTSDFGDDSATRVSSNRICEICHTYDATQANGVKQHAYSMPVTTVHYNSDDCISCHNHSSGFSASGATCDSCHGYPPIPGDGKDGYASQAVEGKGAHGQHVNHIAARQGVTLNPNNDTFGDANVTAVCGACHDMNAATHETGGGTRNINFNGVSTYQFGSSSPAYNGIQGQTSGAPDNSPKTCSNISCHFQDSPWWE